MYDAQATLVTLESQMQSTNEELDQMANGMDDAGDQAAHAANEIEDLGEGMDDASDSALDFSDILGANLISDVVMNGLEAAVDLFKDFAAGSLDAASDVRAAESQFDQTFGDMKKQAKQSLQAISDDTEIATTRMQGDFTKLYAFIKTAGADSATALNISSRAMTAAADNAAYFDRSIEDVTESLQSFLKGNYENDTALGISATETTRNTKANELYAKSFKDLSESQKIDVLLSMVEAGNQASGALGQAAREADSWTNVTGELNEAWRQLQATFGEPVLDAMVPLIQGITGALKEMAEQSSWDILADGVDDFESAMEDAEAACSKAQETTRVTATSAEIYVKRLRELEKQGLDTAEAQQEYSFVVDQLNQLIPDLNLSIDEQTGLLSKNVEAIEADIAAWEQQATMAALQAKYNDVLKARGQLDQQRIDALARLSILNNQVATTEQMIATAMQGATAAERDAIARLLEFPGVYDSAAGAADAWQRIILGGELTTLSSNDALREMVLSLGAAGEEQSKLSAEVASAEEAMRNYDSEIAVASESIKVFNQEQEQGNTILGATSEKVQAAQAAVDELNASYTSAKESARQSIDSQIGYFDELTGKSDMSAEKIIQNWEAQKAAFDEYSVNLQKAVDMGLDEALVQQLSDGSEQSMLILNELVNGTELSVDDINAAFRGTDEARENWANTVGGIKSDYDSTIKEIKDAAAADGVYIVDGLARGVNNNAYRFTNAMSSLAGRGRYEFERRMEINSPSKIMEEDGEFTIAGAVRGVENKIKDFEAVMSKAATAGNSAFLEEKLDMAQSYTQVRNNSVSSTTYRTEHNYGGMNITVQTQPGQDSHAIAANLMEQIRFEVERKEAMAF